MDTNNSRFSSKFEGCSLLQFSCILIGMRTKSTTILIQTRSASPKKGSLKK